MDLLSLELEDFCGHGKSRINFAEFSIAVIIGKTKDNYKRSNGIGKSTIFAAIKYVLFNDVDASSLDKVIRHGTEFCRVSLEFRSSNDFYKIIRTKTKKTSDVRLFKKIGNDWEDITQRKGIDTEKEINKIVKLNSKTFTNSVLFQQFDLSGIASATPSEKKKILKDILQLGSYSKYEILAKKKTNDILKDTDKNKIILSTLGNPEQDLKRMNEEKIIITNQLVEKQNILVNKQKILNDETEHCSKLISQYEDLDKQSNDLYLSFKSLKDDIKKYDKSYNDYLIKIENLQKNNNDINNTIIHLNEQIGTVPDVHQQRLNLQTKAFEISKMRADKKALYGMLAQSIKELKVPLPDDSTCKHCRQKITDSARQSCQESIQREIIECENKLFSLKENILSLDKEYKEILSLTSILDSNEIKINKLKQDISIKESLIKNNKALIEEFNALLLQSKSQLEIRSNSFKEISFKLEALNAKEADRIKDLVLQSKIKINKLSNDLSSMSKDVELLSNNKAILIHKIDQRASDFERKSILENDTNGLERKYFLHQKVVQAFGSKGIPSLITQTILDDLQLETNILLAQLKPELQVQFQIVKDRADGDKEDTLNIVYVLNGHELEYALLSGAQKIIAALALRLGISSIMKKRLGTDINILLIDEVDQSLDEEALETFEEAIKILAKDFKVLIITHNNDLKNKFKTMIVVEQDENLVSTTKVINA